MKVCTCFLLLGIFGSYSYTHSFASNTPKSNQRSVNLAIETVLEFNNNDKELDIKFLDDVQNFITKVKTAIDDNSNGDNLRRHFKAPTIETFTGFIQDVIHILNTYEDTEFEDFFDILNEEIRNYHYRGCKFHELTESYEIRNLIATKLDSIKRIPTSETRAHINAFSDMLQDENYDENVKKVVYYINSLYRQKAGEKFQKVINDLEAYGVSKSKRSYNNLSEIIKNGVRSIIFDHYTNLNTNVRRDFKQQIETFCKQLANDPSTRGNIPNFKPYSKSRNNAKKLESITNEVKNTEPVSKKYLLNIDSKKAIKKVKDIENHENNKDKTEIKLAEYYEDDLENEKKGYKHTTKDMVDELLHIQEKKTILRYQHTGHMDQRRAKNEHQDLPNKDSLSDELYNSIEFYHEPQDKKQQYTTIIPIKPSQKSFINFTMKPERIEAINVTTIMPKKNTVKKIWIEESTGRLPKAVLDKLAVKPSVHESRHSMTGSLLKKRLNHTKRYDKDQKKWHGKRYDPKYVKMNRKKYDKEHDKKRMTKHWLKKDKKHESRQNQKPKKDKKHKSDKTSEPNNPILVHNRDFFRQNYIRTTDSVFNMAVHQYKKSMGPITVEIKSNNRWSTASTKPQKFLEVFDVLSDGKTIKSSPARRTAFPRLHSNEIRRVRKTQKTSPHTSTYSYKRRFSVAPRAYPKIKKKTSWENVEQTSSSSEGMSLEKSDMKDEKRRHGPNAKRTSSSLEKDPFVIKVINNIEKQLNKVKRRINVNTDVVTARKVKHTYEANNDIVKRKQSKTRRRSNANMISTAIKGRKDKTKKAERADNKTERIIKNKNVEDDKSTKNETGNDLKKVKKSETKIKSYINITSSNSKDTTGQRKENKTEYNKAEVKDISFKNIEDKVDNGHQTMEVAKEQAILKKDKKTETSSTNIVNTPKAKNKGIKEVMNNYNSSDARRETGSQNREIVSLSTTAKATEYITKTTATVQPTVAVTTPNTISSSTISVTTSVAISVATSVAKSPKLADVLQKAEFNATVDESINQMSYNASQIAVISKTAPNVTVEVRKQVNSKR